ncbi:subtilisin-like serine protease QhpE [Azospirillum thermophilum]|uniref:Peptidase S8/S53 domain-containing protein n=1 Tax=Azospirillum thermophilum TaxID=2202148 RepID=A0A2S2CKN8_9PROT|nr:S8 family serine peptidase [Azospirillum thermophilum]AWK84877.1 hypothetical protein DEW08_00545 [Azospirillum thermophilum]
MRIAVIDSGIAPGIAPGSVTASGAATVRSAAAFVLTDDGVAQVPARPDRVGHGSAVAAILRALAPAAELVDAQVFGAAPVTSAAAVAAGLRWAVGQGARLATLSFGLPADRPVLRAAVEEALAAGVLLVAASPARGGPVWPAAYPGVLAATGDARCRPGEVSVLPAAFGACPRPLDAADGERPRAGGASLAVAHLAGILAAAGNPDMDRGRAADHLRRIARFHGPERRTA